MGGTPARARPFVTGRISRLSRRKAQGVAERPRSAAGRRGARACELQFSLPLFILRRRTPSRSRIGRSAVRPISGQAQGTVAVVADIDTLSSAISHATAPAFMLGAVAAFLSILISRMERTVDRNRALHSGGAEGLDPSVRDAIAKSRPARYDRPADDDLGLIRRRSSVDRTRLPASRIPRLPAPFGSPHNLRFHAPPRGRAEPSTWAMLLVGFAGYRGATGTSTLAA